MSKTFRPYEPGQLLLLSPDMRDWLPEGHLACFLSDVVDQLDLSAIFEAYEAHDGRGQPPYHPRMMVKLLLYAYCMGKPSSRKVERATYEEVPYRVLAADQHPDHDSIAEFRKRHLQALGSLFVLVLELCKASGLVKLGHVALDGTKIKANASKHKAMSYDRMKEKEKELELEVAALLQAAAAADQEEDARHGKGQRGEQLPAELARRESRLKKIRAAKAALEQAAREQAAQEAQQARAKILERQKQEEETGKKPRGPAPKVPDVERTEPEPKAQRNFTDPESRIMKDGGKKNFEQCYNAQAAVDSHAQIILAAEVTQEANDKQQLAPMLEQVKKNGGELPAKASADAGYFSAAQVTDPRIAAVDLYVSCDRQKHGAPVTPRACHSGPETEELTVIERMREKLKSVEGQALYRMRKAIVEPVFGQVKEGRGFRRFSFRGLENVSAEWKLIALTHNLLKLFRAQSA